MDHGDTRPQVGELAAAAAYGNAASSAAREGPAAGEPRGQAVGPTLDDGIRNTDELAVQLDRDHLLDADGPAPAVTAEWALWGKDADGSEYSVLSCSAGAFDAVDFTQVITRYASGFKEKLPQYTVFWIPGADGNGDYVAVGIHELAGADDRRPRIAGGRPIEYVRLFCVPYAELAGHGLSYTDLVESVMGWQLPPGSTDRISVPLVMEAGLRPVARSFRELAENVAALLLTTQPVCVLGAEHVPAEDRLRFIELVMSLLPYGLRSRLSASTWASSTAQELKLRLFFTGSRRDDGGQASYVTWGKPADPDLSAPRHEAPRLYLNWLRHVGPGAKAALAELTRPLGFNERDISWLLDNLPKDGTVEATLDRLASSLQRGDQEAVRSAVARLRRHLTGQREPADGGPYLRVIVRQGMLKGRAGLHPLTQESVYRVLLQLAFETPLTYDSYCWIEDAVGGPPTGPLRRLLLDEFVFATFVPWLLAWKAEPGPGLQDVQLMASLAQQSIGPETTMNVLRRDAASIRSRPKHAAAAYDFAVHYLRAHTDGDARLELAKLGYLADLLEYLLPRNLSAQQVRLEETLRFVYGGLLSRGQVRDLFGDPGLHPTKALEAAVARMASSRAAVDLIEERAALARISNAGYAEDALIVQRGAQRRSRPFARNRAAPPAGGKGPRLIPRGTLYTAAVVLLVLGFIVFLLIVTARV